MTLMMKPTHEALVAFTVHSLRPSPPSFHPHFRLLSVHSPHPFITGLSCALANSSLSDLPAPLLPNPWTDVNKEAKE